MRRAAAARSRCRWRPWSSTTATPGACATGRGRPIPMSIPRPEPAPCRRPDEPRPLRIGLVYDCREEYLEAGAAPHEVMEFDSRETIDALAASLASLGHAVDRVGRGLDLARRLAAGE